MNKGLLGFAFSAALITASSLASAAAERMDQLTLDALDLDAQHYISGTRLAAPRVRHQAARRVQRDRLATQIPCLSARRVPVRDRD